MSVQILADPDHKAVVFSYDKTLVSGDTIKIVAKNVATDDVGSRETSNNGSFVLFYPRDFSGIDEITVTGSDSGSDTGTVTV